VSPPQTIADYRVNCKLDEGGMGEVWRVTDTKLNRDVVIKILPEAFAHGAFAYDTDSIAPCPHSADAARSDTMNG
jgi:hypothetical protein